MSDLSLAIELGNTTLWFYRGDKAYYPVHAPAYELLEKVEPIRQVASAPSLSGWGKREAPTVKVTLNNPKHELYNLLRMPFRRPCTIYDQNGLVLFSGIISDVDYGLTMTCTVGL